MSDRRCMMPLRDVKDHPKRKVNLIGIVVEFSIPRMSEGTDYCTILKVIDRSQQSPELSVNVFIDDVHQLPHIRSRRDIILLSCVRIERHKQDVYAVFNKSFSSFALFDGKCSSVFSPYQTSPAFCLLDSDKPFITCLRNWCLTFQLDPGISPYVVSLNDIKEREYVDLVCKVLGVCEVSSNEWMLFIWDGTDVPPLSFNTKLEEHSSTRLQIESVPLPTNVISNFPCVGTVLRVIADQAFGKLGYHFHSIGQWVRIRNVLFEVDSGLWKGFLTCASKVRLLSENDNSVAECKRNLTERLSRSGRVPMSSYHVSNFITVLTLTDYESTKFATLMDLLTFSKDKGRFKCIVRVVAICPSQVKDFWSPAGLSRIRVTLEDPTARIHALLCGEDAELFFGGYPSASVLAAKMNKLLGVPGNDDSTRNPPWIQCCLELHLPNEAGALGARHYHIRFTNLVL
ncbi:protection of telomeres protein 1b-like isoform X2 [Rhododendron vialii]|uniref:protection of telomeres protein 1b-like isoform X2 n=1 Tax=Rhododendron vialii TaxID=182163 RepID=UPI00265EF063|nr:protection of telomeres protein 1b-like isoform X2 [Rhododendron vialii]